MANNENLIPIQSTSEAREKGRNGGIRSGEVRRRNADLKKTLEMLLMGEFKNTGKTYEELTALGLITNAIDKRKGGNPNAFKQIREVLKETETNNKTRKVEIEVIDNTHLEKAMYEKKKS